jgi:diketogulonate reductase-like aldo/keto reductase
MPLLGLGVYLIHGKIAEEACLKALETGYRLIDTAAIYQNEAEVGNATRKSGLKREEIFITTKVDNQDQGYESTIKAFNTSLKKLNIDYIDLYLVHWPIRGKRKDTWKALEKLYLDKQVRAIGVANYLIPFLEELKSYATLVPVVDQVEFSPYLFLEDLFSYCKSAQIQLQAYSPLTRGKKFNDPRLVALSKKYNKTPAQILIKWNLELGVSVIPKSSNPQRIKENFDIFDFNLSQADILLLNGFNENFRVVNDPMTML